jgi:hypothetical protein
MTRLTRNQCPRGARLLRWLAIRRSAALGDVETTAGLGGIGRLARIGRLGVPGRGPACRVRGNCRGARGGGGGRPRRRRGARGR